MLFLGLMHVLSAIPEPLPQQSAEFPLADELIGAAVTLMVGFLGFLGVKATVKAQRGSRESQALERMDKELTRIGLEVAALRKEQKKSIRREHIRDDYINELREHIALAKPPPAPPWPSNLYDDIPGE